MLHRTLRLALLPAILAGCAASPAVQPEVAAISATPAAIVFGSCPQKPAWPEAARREQRHGTVTLAFEIEADNTVRDAKVRRSSGHADLDEAARGGLAACKFKAATRDGRPVRGWAELKYVWSL